MLGRYELGPRLASGGAGSVYLARLAGIDDFERLFAIKCIHEFLRDEPGFVEMFLEEARLAARLSHPNIVQVYELAQDGDVLFMAMEYLHAESLAALLRSAHEHHVRVDYDLAAWVMARVSDGLHHAHQVKDKRGQPVGLVHRDVSPQNILVTYDGQVKLIDFGIARAEGRVVKTQQGKIKGKLQYMAPEQALAMDVDHRADQFALGATLFELSTGERLFPGEEGAEIMRRVIAGEIRMPSAVCDDFPVKLENIILRTLERDRKRRYENMGAVARELDAFAGLERKVDLCERLAHLVSELCADSREARERAIRELKNRKPIEIPHPSSPGQPSIPHSMLQLTEVAQVDRSAGTSTALDSFGVQPTDLALTQPDLAGASQLAETTRLPDASELAQTSLIVPSSPGASGITAPARVSQTTIPPNDQTPTRGFFPLVLAIGAIGLLLGLMLVWGAVRLLTKSERIALDVKVLPAVSGTISVQGTQYPAPNAHLELSRSKQPLDVEVQAEGFARERVGVVPDKDQTLSIRLTPVAPAPAPSEPAAAAPQATPEPAPAEPAELPAVASQPAKTPISSGPRKSTKSSRPAKATSESPAGSKSDVIETNPFSKK